MPRRKSKLRIPGICDQGPPSYSESETSKRSWIVREGALYTLEADRTYCVHYSSIRENLDTLALPAGAGIARHT